MKGVLTLMKEKKRFYWGKKACKLLHYTLPLMILPAFILTLYIARLDGTVLLRQREAILLSLETLSRLSVCLALAAVLADYAEKKTGTDR